MTFNDFCPCGFRIRSVTATDDSPRAVVADFLWVVPLDGAKVTLEHCLELMPLLEGLWKVMYLL